MSMRLIWISKRCWIVRKGLVKCLSTVVPPLLGKFVCIYVCSHVCVRVRVRVCVHVYVCVCVHVCDDINMCTYILKYITDNNGHIIHYNLHTNMYCTTWRNALET